jgi:penicillin-binding protein 1A
MAERFGIVDTMTPTLSMALGAGETTLLRLTTAYAMIVNGGKRIHPTFIDRVQDRNGKTIFRGDARQCEGCTADDWQKQPVPKLPDTREQIADPLATFQIVEMMQGVVQYGTGTAVKAVGKPLAGKTGTTNDFKDAWFVGFSPDLAAGVYIGYDHPHSLGRGQTGGVVSAPIFRDFMKMALADQPATPFRVPPGIELVRVDPKTGQRAGPGGGLLEAFKPGTAPPDNYSVIGVADADGRLPQQAPPDSGFSMRPGTGGLY